MASTPRAGAIWRAVQGLDVRAVVGRAVSSTYSVSLARSLARLAQLLRLLYRPHVPRGRHPLARPHTLSLSSLYHHSHDDTPSHPQRASLANPRTDRGALVLAFTLSPSGHRLTASPARRGRHGLDCAALQLLRPLPSLTHLLFSTTLPTLASIPLRMFDRRRSS